MKQQKERSRAAEGERRTVRFGCCRGDLVWSSGFFLASFSPSLGPWDLARCSLGRFSFVAGICLVTRTHDGFKKREQLLDSV